MDALTARWIIRKSGKFGTAIIKSIMQGKDISETDYPALPAPIRLTTREKQVLERLNNFIQLKCEMQDIDPHLIGTTAEMKLLCRNLNNPGSPLPQRLTSGWRKSFLDEFFRQRF